MKLLQSYYCNTNTLQLSKKLLGKKLVTNIDNRLTSGIIVETEAYLGINDKASHAYNYKKTDRTKTMFKKGGIAYVYLCYGMHYLFNIVCNLQDIPHAILIRAIEPLDGIHTMEKRRNFIKSFNLTNGPGKLSQALGITNKNNNQSLTGNNMWLEDIGYKIDDKNILSVPRIGVDYAGEDAKLPYRFYIKNSKWVSDYNVNGQ
tara:strand:+ start:1402 stop:2010 length:609 start_codon:yes stop_codon:yes gene_type:complete